MIIRIVGARAQQTVQPAQATAMKPKPRAPLRLVVVTPGRTIPNWLYQCLLAVERSNAATVELAVRVTPPAPRAAARKPRCLLFSAYQRADRLLFRTDPDALAAIDLRSALPHCRIVDLRHALSTAGRIDVLLDPLCLLPDAELADHSTYGIWTVPFGCSGDARTQSTPAFWEVVEERPSTETRLCIQRRASEKKRLLSLCVAPSDRRSVSRGQARVYWKIAGALTRNLQRLSEDPDAFVEKLEQSARFEVAADPSAGPGNLAMLRAASGLVRRYAADKWRRARYRAQWALAYQRGASSRSAAGAFQTLMPPMDRYWADPFPVRVANDYYIFHEEASFATNKGSIVLSVVDDAGKTTGSIPILETDYHLSYPFVFQWDGEFFMIPESSAHRQIQLYRCISFPARWKLERVLLTGLEALDATPAFLFGKWWLFAAMPVTGAGTSGELHLFYADSPLGPWTPHRANPVKSDVRSTRPAGRIFEQDGQFYRPAQDCSRRYGSAVSINRILQLNPETYAEEEVDRLVPNGEPRVVGLHTINEAGDLTVIDCLIRRTRLWTEPWRSPVYVDRARPLPFPSGP